MKITFKALTLLTAILLTRGSTPAARAQADHAPHDGHAHDEAAGHGGPRIAVTQEQVQRLGIKISRVAPGRVHRNLSAPGEITINADRVAHVVPRATGIVREVHKSLGDRVSKGDILAWVESEELAEAKLTFYAKKSEVGCCEIKLPRARIIFENVMKLGVLLKEEASDEALRKLDGLEMGAYRGKLLSAYTAYLAARTLHEQEARLHNSRISSDRELLTAATELKQAKARFDAIMDTARYETLIAYTEAIQERQLAGFEAAAAEKQLRLKGADAETVATLTALVPKTSSLQPCLCDDPNCGKLTLPSLSETLDKDGRFAWYALRAPFDGTLIEKHIVAGESIDESTEVFTVADLSSVWIELAISQDAIPLVRKAHAVSIQLPDGSTAAGIIDFLSPVISPDTRTALARATIDNTDGLLRPGTFVDADIHIPAEQESVVVATSAVQQVNDRSCVFVWGKADFELREVVTGRADGQRIEILNGLHTGEKVATVNAFHLKAEYIKSAAGDLGAHHGHSH